MKNKQLLEKLNWSTYQFAKNMDISTPSAHNIINEKFPKSTSVKLGKRVLIDELFIGVVKKLIANSVDADKTINEIKSLLDGRDFVLRGRYERD